MNRRGEYEHHRQSCHEGCRPSHTTITPATTRAFQTDLRDCPTRSCRRGPRCSSPTERTHGNYAALDPGNLFVSGDSDSVSRDAGVHERAIPGSSRPSTGRPSSFRPGAGVSDARHWPFGVSGRCQGRPAEAFGNPVHHAPDRGPHHDHRHSRRASEGLPVRHDLLGLLERGLSSAGWTTTGLPTSGGAVHIGFRVQPSSGRPTRVTALRVRWHCVDHYFGLLHGTTVVRNPSPIFDC
jgi:hypothetical protein